VEHEEYADINKREARRIVPLERFTEIGN